MEVITKMLRWSDRLELPQPSANDFLFFFVSLTGVPVQVFAADDIAAAHLTITQHFLTAFLSQPRYNSSAGAVNGRFLINKKRTHKLSIEDFFSCETENHSLLKSGFDGIR